MDAFIGEIRIFSFNYAPYNWAYCDGSTQYVQQQPALFSLIGFTYGGNGTTTFQLPKLAGRAVVGVGSSPYTLGSTMGSETVALLPEDLPAHNHMVNGESQTVAAQLSGTPSSTVIPSRCADQTLATKKVFTDANAPIATMAPSVIATNGNNLPHENRQPVLAMNFCICMSGEYPPFD